MPTGQARTDAGTVFGREVLSSHGRTNGLAVDGRWSAIVGRVQGQPEVFFPVGQVLTVGRADFQHAEFKGRLTVVLPSLGQLGIRVSFPTQVRPVATPPIFHVDG
jgi:hypothetical protein